MVRKFFLTAGCLAATLTGPSTFAAPSPAKPSLAKTPSRAALPGSPALECTATAQFAVSAEVEITQVRWIAAPVPYCRVDGRVHTDKPGPNTVGFMIALPHSWNGRYLMVVPGGSAGSIVNPSAEHLTLGYAVSSTDKGSHSPGSLDMSFRADAGRSEDYAHRGTHVAAVATQAIARSYYRRAAMPRYLMGCSGGGLSTLMEAERYPEDADGFIAGAAPTDLYVQTFWALVAQHLVEDPARWISPADMKRVGDAIMTAYDAADGAGDGLIWDPRRIKLERSLFPFLTDAQFSTLQLLERGVPRIPGSELSAPGYWLSNPSILGPIVLGATPPPWTARTRPPLFGSTVLSMAALQGADYDYLTQLDLSDAEKRNAEARRWEKVGGYDLDPARLTKLQDRGGRLIFWSGAADEAIPPKYLTGYSDKIRATLGPSSQSFYQSFLVPGMFHCRGGEATPTDTSLALLQAMQRWVESGEAPQEVILTNSPKAIEVNSTSNTSQSISGMSTSDLDKRPDLPRTYRICAYPRHAQYVGSKRNPSDLTDSRNWRCSN